MKPVACVLLLSGFFIGLAALALLHSLGQRAAFVGAGFAVEVLGLTLLVQAYRPAAQERR